MINFISPSLFAQFTVSSCWMWFRRFSQRTRRGVIWSVDGAILPSYSSHHGVLRRCHLRLQSVNLFSFAHSTGYLTDIPFNSLRNRSDFLCLQDMDAKTDSARSWHRCVDHTGRYHYSDDTDISMRLQDPPLNVWQVALTQSISILVASLRVRSL